MPAPLLPEEHVTVEMDMDSKHTAGPWTAKHVGGSNFAVQAFDIRAPFGSKPHVYPIFNRDASSVNGTVVYVSPGDAALVAAAPDLLEALNGIRELVRLADHSSLEQCSAALSDIDAIALHQITKAEAR